MPNPRMSFGLSFLKRQVNHGGRANQADHDAEHLLGTMQAQRRDQDQTEDNRTDDGADGVRAVDFADDTPGIGIALAFGRTGQGNGETGAPKDRRRHDRQHGSPDVLQESYPRASCGVEVTFPVR